MLTHVAQDLGIYKLNKISRNVLEEATGQEAGYLKKTL